MIECGRQVDLLQRFVGHPEFPRRDSEYIRWYPKSLSPPPNDEELRKETPKPVGIYIHVPFCDRLCRFCPFNKRESNQQLIHDFVQALKKEISIYSTIVESQGIEFVYFGGGTPSVMSPSDVGAIIDLIDESIGLDPEAEITLESHPSHINSDFLKSMTNAGANRFSTGIQSFDDEALSRLGAQHTSHHTRDAVRSADKAGIALSIDLLFRCEGQNLGDWRSELQQALQYDPITHISCYSLVLKSSARQPSALEEAEMTVLIGDLLGAAGYEHYASCASGGFDYALPGHRCRYELRHWGAPQAEFIGLGPGALGFIASRTTVNGLDIGNYCRSLEDHNLPLVSATKANRDESMRRYFVLGVKTLDVPMRPFEEMFGCEPAEHFEAQLAELSNLGLANVDRDRMRLSDIGSLFVDTVSSMFFSDFERFVPHPEEPEIRRMELRTLRAAF